MSQGGEGIEGEKGEGDEEMFELAQQIGRLKPLAYYIICFILLWNETFKTNSLGNEGMTPSLSGERSA